MYDVIVIGGSFAGLTAALQLGRASRSVLVIDAGLPRNRTSAGAHGVAGWDGIAPAEILGRFRDDLKAYPHLSQRGGKATAIGGQMDAFSVTLENGEDIAAKRLILAHGVRDILPDVPGLAAGWGRQVLHCPYCHGYEVKGEPLAVLATSHMGAHQALMLRADWSDRVTLITGGMDGLDHAALELAGVQMDSRALEAAQIDESGITLNLSGGGRQRFAALFLAPRTTLAESPAAHLGCALSDGPMGPFVKVGPMAQTSIPGVFAAGDVARPMPNINFALADGAQAGSGCHASLLFPEIVTPVEASQ